MFMSARRRRLAAVVVLAMLACAGLPGGPWHGLFPSADASGQPAPRAAVQGIRLAAKPKAASRQVAQKDAPPAREEPGDAQHPFPRRQRAAALDGGREWINTAGPIDLKQLRGKFVLLDFWTYCCINCMHILPELKKLEEAYPNEIVVIGVHSAKFETEQDSKSIHQAIERNGIVHPVVNDADHKIWESYEVQSWPSLRVIDPVGDLVAGNSGEIDFATLDRFFKDKMPYYRAKGLLKPDAPVLTGEQAGHKVANTPLRYPGKVLADEKSRRLFIADSNHNRIVVASLDGELVYTIGSGAIGADDGDFQTATFNHPQGMALSGDALYVADTENHLLRKVDLKKKRVTTLAGTGKQGHGWPGMDEFNNGAGTVAKHRWAGPALKTALNSPWALCFHGHDLYIAMAGSHQIWKMSTSKPAEIAVYAGNGREDIVDGPLVPGRPYEESFCSFAQPSGLSSDGKQLFVADSEGSSIRAVPLDGKGEVSTVIGTSWLRAGRLFAFGDVDGQGQKVRLQHALEVVSHGGLLYVADTYNNKIKVIDPRQTTSRTLAGSGKPGDEDEPAMFDEPAGLAYARDKLYVADTNNHAIRTIDLKGSNQVATLEVKGLEPPASPKTEIKPGFPGAAKVDLATARLKPDDGKLHLKVLLELPPGYKINPIAPLRYLVEAGASQGPVSRDALGTLTEVEEKSASFDIDLAAAATTGTDKLRISLAFYYCQTGGEGVCKASSVVWNLPITLAADAPGSTVQLPFKVR